MAHLQQQQRQRYGGGDGGLAGHDDVSLKATTWAPCDRHEWQATLGNDDRDVGMQAWEVARRHNDLSKVRGREGRVCRSVGRGRLRGRGGNGVSVCCTLPARECLVYTNPLV